MACDSIWAKFIHTLSILKYMGTNKTQNLILGGENKKNGNKKDCYDVECLNIVAFNNTICWYINARHLSTFIKEFWPKKTQYKK
jgi:hypothetical protein